MENLPSKYKTDFKIDPENQSVVFIKTDLKQFKKCKDR